MNDQTKPEMISDADLEQIEGGGVFVGNPGKTKRLKDLNDAADITPETTKTRRLMSGAAGGTNI